MENKKKIEKLKDKIKKLKDIDEERYKNDIQELENEIEKLKNPLPAKEINYSAIFFWIFIGVIVILVLTLPTKSITCYEEKTIIVQEPKIVEDCDWEDVPKIVEDCDWEDKPYSDTEYNTRDLNSKSIPYSYPISTCIERKICEEWSQICVDKNFWGNCVEWEDECISWGCSKQRKTCKYYIKNLDDYYGVWSVESTIKNKDTGNSEYLGKKSAYLYEMDETTLEWNFETSRLDDTYSCEYKVTRIPTTTESEDVIKFKPKWVCESITIYENKYICEDTTIMEDVKKIIQEPYTKNVNWLYGDCNA